MLTQQEQYRYHRHLILDSIGTSGQLKLKDAKVLVVGVGGLGCPALLYLAAAGVGKIGIMDSDVVGISNLQRQILFKTDDIGAAKAIVAVERLRALNPQTKYVSYHEKLSASNALPIIDDYDLVIDGTDNFETKYLLNDACVLLNKVLIHGSIYKFEGQVSVFNFPMNENERSGTYRCLFPKPVADNLNCSQVGVLGVLPGVVGTLQATEAIKIICNTGTPLFNRLLMVDLSGMNFTSWNFSRNEAAWTNFPLSKEDFAKMNYQLFCNDGFQIQQINPIELQELIQANEKHQIIDLRSEHEIIGGMLPNTLHIPFNQLKMRVKEVKTNVKTVMVCASGNRSELAIKYLETKMNRSLLYNLQGGMRSFNFEKLILKYD